MARWVNLDDCVEISAGEMRFYPVELLGDVYEEVVPVVHAFWFWTDDSKQRKEFQCSNCGKFVKNHENLTYLEFTETFQYCPKCGAKMDEIYLTVRLEGE